MTFCSLLHSTPFYKLLVPTVDTVRYQYLTSNLLKALCPVMLVGPVGTGKTSVAEDVLNKLDASKYSVLVLNMSAQVRYIIIIGCPELHLIHVTKLVICPIELHRLKNILRLTLDLWTTLRYTY